MKDHLIITYQHGGNDVFEEKHLDTKTWTMRGHASNLIEALKTGKPGIFRFDEYNAVTLGSIISVRVVSN